ncbi:hypothetical protein FO269_03120 [Lacticaseibacillus paracasei]|nr:hypothetical protein [Lacticaseibacillus paracasei]QDR74250.1 hypothetical protein FO269_03120 [Lacticaseibacillus paracasei]
MRGSHTLILSVTYADIIYQMGLKNKIEVEMSKNSKIQTIQKGSMQQSLPCQTLRSPASCDWRRAARAETALRPHLAYDCSDLALGSL